MSCMSRSEHSSSLVLAVFRSATKPGERIDPYECIHVWKPMTRLVENQLHLTSTDIAFSLIEKLLLLSFITVWSFDRLIVWSPLSSLLSSLIYNIFSVIIQILIIFSIRFTPSRHSQSRSHRHWIARLQQFCTFSRHSSLGHSIAAKSIAETLRTRWKLSISRQRYLTSILTLRQTEVTIKSK